MAAILGVKVFRDGERWAYWARTAGGKVKSGHAKDGDLDGAIREACAALGLPKKTAAAFERITDGKDGAFWSSAKGHTLTVPKKELGPLTIPKDALEGELRRSGGLGGKLTNK